MSRKISTITTIKYIFKSTFISAFTSPSPIIHHLSLYISINTLPNKNIKNNIEDPMDIQKFDRIGYSFRADLSSDNEYVFERNLAKLFR